jgi:hypothetical protein
MERLVWFWTNHFVVSLRRGECSAVAAAFVEEAIRPHVTGHFGDMLLAVMRHPGMLLYLDNATSFGPESPAGQRTHRGLNENLARECLELHIVSPAAGYTQADVTAFANILTGWSIDLKADPPGSRYRPFAHQPGVQTVMQQQFPAGRSAGANPEPDRHPGGTGPAVLDGPGTEWLAGSRRRLGRARADVAPDRLGEQFRRPHWWPRCRRCRGYHTRSIAPRRDTGRNPPSGVAQRCDDTAADQPRIPKALI